MVFRYIDNPLFPGPPSGAIPNYSMSNISIFRRARTSRTMPEYGSEIYILTRLAYNLNIASFRAMWTSLQKRRKRREPGKPKFKQHLTPHFPFIPGPSELFHRPAGCVPIAFKFRNFAQILTIVTDPIFWVATSGKFPDGRPGSLNTAFKMRWKLTFSLLNQKSHNCKFPSVRYRGTDSPRK